MRIEELPEQVLRHAREMSISEVTIKKLLEIIPSYINIENLFENCLLISRESKKNRFSNVPIIHLEHIVIMSGDFRWVKQYFDNLDIYFSSEQINVLLKFAAMTHSDKCVAYLIHRFEICDFSARGLGDLCDYHVINSLVEIEKLRTAILTCKNNWVQSLVNLKNILSSESIPVYIDCVNFHLNRLARLIEAQRNIGECLLILEQMIDADILNAVPLFRSTMEMFSTANYFENSTLQRQFDKAISLGSHIVAYSLGKAFLQRLKYVSAFSYLYRAAELGNKDALSTITAETNNRTLEIRALALLCSGVIFKREELLDASHEAYSLSIMDFLNFKEKNHLLSIDACITLLQYQLNKQLIDKFFFLKHLADFVRYKLDEKEVKPQEKMIFLGKFQKLASTAHFCDSLLLLADEMTLSRESQLAVLTALSTVRFEENNAERLRQHFDAIPAKEKTEFRSKIKFTQTSSSSSFTQSAELSDETKTQLVACAKKEMLSLRKHISDPAKLVALIQWAGLFSAKETTREAHKTANAMRGLLASADSDLLFYLMQPEQMSPENIKTEKQKTDAISFFKLSLQGELSADPVFSVLESTPGAQK